MRIDRHEFLRMVSGTAAAMMLRPFRLAAGGPDVFYVALVADPHLIDRYYRGPEATEEDTASLAAAADRLTKAAHTINRLSPSIDHVFLIGDLIHEYSSADRDFYFTHRTSFDRAAEILATFRMPVHVGLGDHDYGKGSVARDLSHELFRRRLRVMPYSSIDYRGWKFVHLNACLGATWTRGTASYDPATGSLGETQLNWFEAELAQRKPTMVFIHYPLAAVVSNELKDHGVHTLLHRYADTITRVVGGHWHRWVDFGHAYGPTHLVMAATRYDENAYLIVEVNTRTGRHELLNLDLVQWNTHFSAPYPGRR